MFVFVFVSRSGVFVFVFLFILRCINMSICHINLTERTVVLWSYGSHFLILRLMVRARPTVWSQATGNCLQMLDLFYIWLKWLLCTNEPIKLSKDSSCQVFLQYWCRHPKHSKLQAKKGNASDNIYDKEKETGGNIQILREGSFAKLGGEVTRTEFKFARGTTDPWVDIII